MSHILAPANARLVATFSGDEWELLGLIRHALDTRSLVFTYTPYPHALLILVTAPLLLLTPPVSDQTIMLAMRLASLLPAIGVCLVMLAFAGWRVGLVAVLFLLGSDSFVAWSITGHPDMLQLLAISLSLLALCRCRLGAAAIAAGVAWSVKFGGVLLLPLLVIAGIWHDRPLALARIAACFVLGVVIASPDMRLADHVAGVTAQMHSTGTGRNFQSHESTLRWFLMLYREVGIIGCAGFVLALYRPRRWVVVLSVWIATVLLFLVARVHALEPRYLLLVTPFIFLVAMWRFRRVGALLTLLAVPSVAQNARYVQHRAHRDVTNRRVRAGRWLARHEPHSARVLYDWYSYVPPEFSNARASWGMTEAEVREYRPDVIVTNSILGERYGDASRCPDFVDGSGPDRPAACRASHQFYAALAAGETNYRRVLHLARASVYERR